MGKPTKRRRRRSFLDRVKEFQKEKGPKPEIGPAQQESGNAQTIQQVVGEVKRATMNEKVSRPKLVLLQFRIRPDQREWLKKKAEEGYGMNELVRRLIDKGIEAEEKEGR